MCVFSVNISKTRQKKKKMTHNRMRLSIYIVGSDTKTWATNKLYTFFRDIFDVVVVCRFTNTIPTFSILAIRNLGIIIIHYILMLIASLLMCVYLRIEFWNHWKPCIMYMRTIYHSKWKCSILKCEINSNKKVKYIFAQNFASKYIYVFFFLMRDTSWYYFRLL